MKVKSKKSIINNIIEYVFKTYCDDEQVALFIQDYYEIERKAEERRKRKIQKCQDKCHDKIYKITQEVKDFLEPLVDAEYYKDHYIPRTDCAVIYLAMQQLNTRVHRKLVKKLMKEVVNENKF